MIKSSDVRSVVIDWQTEKLEITDKDNVKHIVPLANTIHVTMEGERNEKHMKAGALGEYMSNGYIIQQIRYLEDDDIRDQIARQLDIQRDTGEQ